VGIKPRPVNGIKCIWWRVPQQCQGQSEKHEPSKCIHGHGDYESQIAQDFVIIGFGFKDCEADFDGTIDDEGDGEYSNWDNGDSEGGDTPKFLFCISGERKIPPCTMDSTEEGAKSNEEEGMKVRGISVSWNVEGRDVCGATGEGR